MAEESPEQLGKLLEQLNSANEMKRRMNRFGSERSLNREESMINGFARIYLAVKKLPNDPIAQVIRDILKSNILLSKMVVGLGLIQDDSNESLSIAMVDFDKLISEYSSIQHLINDDDDFAKDIVELFQISLYGTHKGICDRQDKVITKIFETAKVRAEEVDLYELDSSQVQEFKSRFPFIKVFKVNPDYIAVAGSIAILLKTLSFNLKKITVISGTSRSIEREFEVNFFGNRLLSMKTMESVHDGHENGKNLVDIAASLVGATVQSETICESEVASDVA